MSRKKKSGKKKEKIEFGGLNENVEKSVKDIKALFTSGVDLDLVAKVKDVSISELTSFVRKHSIKMPTPDIPEPRRSKRVASRKKNPAEEEEEEEEEEVEEVKKPTPPPPEFVKPPKKRKLPNLVKPPPVKIVVRTPQRRLVKMVKKKYKKDKWKESDFPEEKAGKDHEFYCADCKTSCKSYHCKICKRKCWKWCDDEKCQSYKSNHHKCFKKTEPVKKRAPWRKDHFPKQNVGKFYCLDCKKSNEKRLCECGRDSWTYCKGCGEYLSKHHDFQACKKNKDEDDESEEEEEEESRTKKKAKRKKKRRKREKREKRKTGKKRKRKSKRKKKGSSDEDYDSSDDEDIKKPKKKRRRRK